MTKYAFSFFSAQIKNMFREARKSARLRSSENSDAAVFGEVWLADANPNSLRKVAVKLPRRAVDYE